MTIREATISDKEKWNNFVETNETGSFLQTWEWSEFISEQGKTIHRFIVETPEKILAVFFIYEETLKGGMKTLYSPKGPVIDNNEDIEKIFSIAMAKVENLAQQTNAIIFECDPETNNPKYSETYNKLRLEKAVNNAQPRHTLILDIRHEKEELQKQMHKKTSYNIRLAKKKGVTVEVDNTKFKEFNELLKKTTKRQAITMFNQKYFLHLLKLPFVKLYLAKYEGKYIACNIMIFWNKTAIYLYGASDYEYRNVMAPHLLQWEAIKNAKDQDFWFYDFWGAAPKDSTGKEENWFGFTKFKMGFSPDAEITEYLGTYEKVYSPVKLGIYRFLQQRFKK